MKGKRIVSEKQTIHVRKYAWVQDQPQEIVQQKVTVQEPRPGGIFSGLKRRKKQQNPTEKAEEFARVLDR